MDTEIAKINMLKQQLRTNGVVNDALLIVFDEIPREKFVPVGYDELAYADSNIPIGHGQVMLTPTLEAKILQYTAIQRHEKVMEIGTGTGYLTSLLARLGHHVTSIDIFPDFINQAKENLAELDITNISLHAGNAATGWGKHLFDVIIASGAMQFLSPSLLEQLAPGGRMFAVMGKAPAMQACLITREQGQGLITKILFEVVLPPLIDAPCRESFSF